MKNRLLLPLIYILILAACTPPATTSTPPTTGEPPIASAEIPTEQPTQPPASEDIQETETSTPRPEGKTIIVTSNADSGPGTFRQALQDAQPYDTILFDPEVFPPEAPETILVSSEPLGIHQGHVTIDASNAGVIIDGSDLPRDSWDPGLDLVSDGNIVWGLHITNFTGTGIVVALRGKDNIIGGDRGIGEGPYGQGNLSTNNNFGIGLWDYASNNLVIGNLVGTDLSEDSNLGNWGSGIWIVEGGRNNIIGPDNIIAHNSKCGIEVDGANTFGNTFTQNSIYHNQVAGICIGGGANGKIGAPNITAFDLNQGLLTGTTCVACLVEIYSDSGGEGTIFEGQAVGGGDGLFLFDKGSPFTEDNITSLTTDAEGNTSPFSRAVGLVAGIETLQVNNDLPKFQLLSLPSNQLPPDTRLGAGLYSSNIFGDIPNLEYLLQGYLDMGIKRLDTSMQEIEEPIDWNKPEFHVYPEYDQFVNDLNQNGIAVNYMLHFWNKDGRSAGENVDGPRFKTETQFEDFMEYVRFVVEHFKGRVQYYTLWSEPDACGGTDVKCIHPQDYIELARRTIPLIKDIDPQAKVVTAPNVIFYDLDFLLQVLRSDAGPLFDAVSWHGIYDVTPGSEVYGDYYERYPSILDEIKATATANGFNGEFWGTEITFCSMEYPGCRGPENQFMFQNTDREAAKYYARLFILQMSKDTGVGWGGLESTSMPYTYPTIRNLNTVMAGTIPADLLVEIENGPPNMKSFEFRTPDGDFLFAIWSDVKVEENFPGVSTNLTFLGLTAEFVEGIDVLNGYLQELVTEKEDSNLIIRDLLVKDYPILIRLTDVTSP